MVVWAFMKPFAVADLNPCVAQNNMAELQVHVAGSSIAMLQGQRPPFRLLVRATGARDGRRLDYIKPAVSDAFVVFLLHPPC